MRRLALVVFIITVVCGQCPAGLIGAVFVGGRGGRVFGTFEAFSLFELVDIFSVALDASAVFGGLVAVCASLVVGGVGVGVDVICRERVPQVGQLCSSRYRLE